MRLRTGNGAENVILLFFKIGSLYQLKLNFIKKSELPLAFLLPKDNPFVLFSTMLPAVTHRPLCPINLDQPGSGGKGPL